MPEGEDRKVQVTYYKKKYGKGWLVEYLKSIGHKPKQEPEIDPDAAPKETTSKPHVDVCRTCHGRQNVCQTIDGFGHAVRGNVWITCPTCMGSGGR